MSRRRRPSRRRPDGASAPPGWSASRYWAPRWCCWAPPPSRSSRRLSLPGDRATVILNVRAGQAIERTPEELAPIIAEFGLDDPLFVQYVDYVSGLVAGRPRHLVPAVPTRDRHRRRPAGRDDRAHARRARARVGASWSPGSPLTAGRGPRVRAFGAFADILAAGLAALLARHHPAAGVRARAGLVPGHRRHRGDRPRASGARPWRSRWRGSWGRRRAPSSSARSTSRS